MDAVESKNHRKIRISSQLYDELREFCDQVEISFLNFVEESLEAATRRYELEELLNDEAKIKAKIKTEQEQAYLDGFERGVLISLLALDGQLAISRKLTPNAVKEKPRYRVVTGEQMKLFE
jgi:cell division septum initiation protein DivIVA